eukprot:gene9014-18668_t
MRGHHNREVQIYHPTLNEPVELVKHRHHSHHDHKQKSKTDQIFEDNRPPLNDTLDPLTTQKRILVRVQCSNEVQIRKINFPNFRDREEVHDNWLEEIEEEKKAAAKLEAKRKRWERRKRQLEKSMNDGADSKEGDGEEDGEDFEEFEDSDDDSDDDGDEVQQAALALREKKLCTNRRTYTSHNPRGLFSKVKTAIALSLTLGWRSKLLTEVLPWMWVGEASASENLAVLLKLGITHILNVTFEAKNCFPDKFVYKQIKLHDSPEEDAGAKFDKAIKFIGRVAECRGRIYIHCQAGVSRSPAMALAYLVVERGLCLADAYDYMQERRPILEINSHFMFQLAELEVKQGFGSSVLAHKDFKFFEMNLLRTPTTTIRSPIGLWSTVMKLHAGTMTRRTKKKVAPK